jgi:DNA-binding CsgD family transcriptional regulator
MLPALAPGDLAHLRTALRLLLNPLEFSDDSTWRKAVCEQLLGWVDTDGVHAVLTTTARNKMVGVGPWSNVDLDRDYVARWHDQMEVDRRRTERRLTSWNRYDLISPSEFRRTTYFKEFCSVSRNFDSAGALHRLPSGGQILLYFNAKSFGRFRSDDKSATVLRLLQPSLAPAITILNAFGSAARDWGRIDTAGTPIGLLALDGRLIHATPELSSLLAHPQTGPAISHGMRQIAGEMRRLLARGPANDARCRPTRQIASTAGPITVSGSFIDAPAVCRVPLCLVTVTAPSSTVTGTPALLTTASLRERFGLTPREAEVALFLARGRRNAQIALALHVTEHTARRHTERVLLKLGVHSRAEVAAALAEPAGDSGRDGS